MKIRNINKAVDALKAKAFLPVPPPPTPPHPPSRGPTAEATPTRRPLLLNSRRPLCHRGPNWCTHSPLPTSAPRHFPPIPLPSPPGDQPLPPTPLIRPLSSLTSPLAPPDPQKTHHPIISLVTGFVVKCHDSAAAGYSSSSSSSTSSSCSGAYKAAILNCWSLRTHIFSHLFTALKFIHKDVKRYPNFYHV